MLRLVLLISIWLIPLGAHADELQARELFSAGVQAILARNWPEAVRLLEASLAHKDKPACRFNLVVANRELHRPLEVARHAIAFLATVEGRSHSEEALEIRAFLAAALRELVTLQVEGLPLGAQLKIDDRPPRVTDGSRIYELPGLHRLELWVGERQLESIEIELDAGVVQSWPRVRAVREPAAAEASAAQSTASHESPDAPSGMVGPVQPRVADPPSADAPPMLSAPTKKKLAWTLGLTGAVTGLAAFVSYGYAARRAGELQGWNPSETGYTTAADRYSRVQTSVMPLALASGALMAAATPFVAHKPRAALTVSIAALVAGVAAASVGTVLMVRTPKTLIEGTDLTGPSREAGSLFLGVALPLLTYGARLQFERSGAHDSRRP